MGDIPGFTTCILKLNTVNTELSIWQVPCVFCTLESTSQYKRSHEVQPFPLSKWNSKHTTYPWNTFSRKNKVFTLSDSINVSHNGYKQIHFGKLEMSLKFVLKLECSSEDLIEFGDARMGLRWQGSVFKFCLAF